MSPKEEIKKGQEKLSKKSTPFFGKWFGWGKASEKPGIQSVSTAYCRTHAFYNEVLGADYREWFEAYEIEKGTWNVIKKSRRPYFETEINLDEENQDSSQDFCYESQELRKGVSFLDALMVLRQCEEGLIALETAKIKRKPHHHYSDVLKEEGLVWDSKNNKFIFIDEGERQTKESDEKINQKIVFAALKQSGRDLENANTDKNLSLYHFFEDPAYHEALQRVVDGLEEINIFLKEMLLSLKEITGKNGEEKGTATTTPKEERGSSWPLKIRYLGIVKTEDEKNLTDRYSCREGKGDYTLTGPFVVEKYGEAILSRLHKNVFFLSKEIEESIKVFVHESMIMASLLHGYKLYNSENTGDTERLFIKERLLIEKKIKEAGSVLELGNIIEESHRILFLGATQDDFPQFPNAIDLFLKNLDKEASISLDHKQENKNRRSLLPKLS